ncbi:hypothetical protein K7432_011100, partial [Basidiobolus ranarum]
MLIQQNNFADFLTNDRYQSHSSNQKNSLNHTGNGGFASVNGVNQRKSAVPRNSVDQNNLIFPFSGSTSTADVPKFGQGSHGQLFHRTGSDANLTQNHFFPQPSNNMYMDTNSDRNLVNTSGSHLNPSSNSGNSAGTSLTTDNQSAWSYSMKNQQQYRNGFNVSQQTWKDRKDPYSSKPTSTLVDFECISPPPPPKKLFFGSDPEGYYSTQSRYVENSNTFSKNPPDHQLFRRNLNIRDFSTRENEQAPNTGLSYEKYTPGPSFANQFQTQMLPSYSSSHRQDDYGHFMATAANLIDPWVNTSMLFTAPHANLLNDTQSRQSGVLRGGHQPSFQHMMLPPPSPTILLYYQQDPAHFNFNGNHQLAYQPNSNFYHPHEQITGRPYNSNYAAEDPRFGYPRQISIQSHQHHSSNGLHGTEYSNSRNQFNSNHLNEKAQSENHNGVQLNSNGLNEPNQILYLRSNHPQLVSSYDMTNAPVNGNHFTPNHYNRSHYEQPSNSLSCTRSHFSGTLNTQHSYHHGLTNNHVQQLVPGTSITLTDARSDKVRDQILTHAHSLYSSTPQDSNLLPILHCLHELHPKHLPTLLLLACVYFSREDTAKSLYYNSKILEIDPNYVEAMSNIGTTLRSTGRCSEAENWWWRAISLRPG